MSDSFPNYVYIHDEPCEAPWISQTECRSAVKSGCRRFDNSDIHPCEHVSGQNFIVAARSRSANIKRLGRYSPIRPSAIAGSPSIRLVSRRPVSSMAAWPALFEEPSGEPTSGSARYGSCNGSFERISHLADCFHAGELN
jgi:hypothetical protein